MIGVQQLGHSSSLCLKSFTEAIVYFEAMSGKRHLVFLLSSGDIFINLSEERQGMGVEQSGEIFL